jgi:hypothetical protein
MAQSLARNAALNFVKVPNFNKVLSRNSNEVFFLSFTMLVLFLQKQPNLKTKLTMVYEKSIYFTLFSNAVIKSGVLCCINILPPKNNFKIN